MIENEIGLTNDSKKRGRKPKHSEATIPDIQII